MSTVMAENKIRVLYALDPDVVLQHWVRTGEFLGRGAYIDLPLDQKWKRQLIADLGWHELDMDSPPPILDPDAQIDPWPIRNVGWTYDGYLNEKAAWNELKVLAKEVRRLTH